jgi:probable rRNA maturation factor
VAQILEIFSWPETSAEIYLTHDREIAGLSASFFGVLAPTNVLSFPEENSEGPFLGSMIISVEALNRESFLYDQEVDIYLIRLLAHGMLHLAGYEHGELMDNLTDLAVENVRLSE